MGDEVMVVNEVGAQVRLGYWLVLDVWWLIFGFGFEVGGGGWKDVWCFGHGV